MKKAYLGLGSSLGKKEHLLFLAIEDLKKYGEIRKVSSFFYNPACGGIAQNIFLNIVLEIKTELDPEKLLEVCQLIEKQHGRTRTQKWDDRSLDIDIISYENRNISLPHLTIPHPLSTQRDFVLKPLKEVCSFRIMNEKILIEKKH